MAEKIRILIADDHEIYREGLKDALRKIGGITVIGEASSGLELLSHKRLAEADIILMDLVMPQMDGIEATRQLRKICPWVRVIFLTMLPTASEMNAMEEAGGAGFLLKNSVAMDLKQAIGKAVKGKIYIPGDKMIRDITNKMKNNMKTMKKILIVDDDPDVITVVETILKSRNYEVITANNKSEGIIKARENRPDLAILDVMMTTHYEGFEMAQEILNDPGLKKLPFLIQTSMDVLTTTHASVQEMAREYRKDPNFKDLQVLLVKNLTTGDAGIDYRSPEGRNIWFPVNGFLRKPVESQKLLQEIDRVLMS